MNTRGQALSRKLRNFSAELKELIQRIDADDWRKILPSEQWSVGVTLRHLAAGHLGLTGLARMMVNGEKLPEITLEGLREMANQHARDHAGCKKQEVLGILEQNSAEIVSFAAGLSDEQLDRTGRLAATGEISVQQVIENVVFVSGGEHAAHIKMELGIADNA